MPFVSLSWFSLRPSALCASLRWVFGFKWQWSSHVNIQPPRPAHEPAAALEESQRTMRFACDADAYADADLTGRTRFSAQPQRAIAAQVQANGLF